MKACAILSGTCFLVYFFLVGIGICANTIATNISKHPNNSLVVNISCKKSQPARADTTDSKHKIKEATVGFMPFCPTICSV